MDCSLADVTPEVVSMYKKVQDRVPFSTSMFKKSNVDYCLTDVT